MTKEAEDGPRTTRREDWQDGKAPVHSKVKHRVHSKVKHRVHSKVKHRVHST